MERRELRALVEATGCAEESNGVVFLCDPGWIPSERDAVVTLKSAASDCDAGWLAVRTGGSGGGVKFALHDEGTLATAVAGWRAHFGLEKVNAIDVLPAHHVSGLMARVRCRATGGRHVAWNWKALEAGELPRLADDGGPWVLSLVPTQLQRLLRSTAAVQWLQRFAVVFVGGGPAWPMLIDRAIGEGVAVSISYGMTETAAMVTALRPEETAAGERSCGAPLPHARIRIGTDGVIAIEGGSICHGYLEISADGRAIRRRFQSAGEAPVPGAAGLREFVTEDLGRIDEQGHLHVLGRRDAVIITGGKKVQSEAVEAALRASGEFVDVAVVGLPDEEWGEVIVACYPRGERAPDLQRAISGLAPYQRPKRFVALKDWPRMSQGKVSRAALRAAILDAGS